MKENVQIDLTKDEAIVLFEFASRFLNENILEISDQSEERVLWNIQCDLEKMLSEVFSEKYKEILKNARDRVRDEI